MQPQLTADQYQLILKYMQATSQQDFQSATRILREYNFNINTAINARFNQHEPRAQRHQRMEEQVNDDDEVVGKYIQFVQKENEASDVISSTFGFVKNFTVGLIKLLSQILLPEVLLRKVLRSKFYVLYKDEVKMKVEDNKLVRLLMNTKQKSYKPVIIVISPINKAQCIVQMLNKNDIVKKIQDNFFFVGFVQGDHDIQSIRDQRPPQIIICRYNIYKQLQIITRLTGHESIRQMTLQQLQNSLELGRNMHKQDKNVLIKYRNFIRRQYYGGQIHMEEEEQEEVNFIAREEDTQHIRQQNEEYERMMRQEEIRRQEQRREEQQRRKQLEMLEEKQQERQCRKLSIPDEPQSGDIIRFSFRCPDGSNLTRAFLSTQKVQILYHWVETNQQIQLQDNKKREFEIMYSYPPTALSSQKDKLLKEVFESDQQKLLIREL